MRELRIFLFSGRKIHETEGTEKTWYAVFRTWSRFGDRRIFYKKQLACIVLAAAFACLGLSVCCAQPGSAVIPMQAADYDASLQDERTAYVANKARSLTFFICIYAQLLAVLAAILVFHQPLDWQSSLRADLYSVAHLIPGATAYYNRKYSHGSFLSWNSYTAASRLANCTLPMFASTASWLRLLPMAFCCRRTSFESVKNHDAFSETTGGHIVALAHVRLNRFLADCL